MNIFPLMAKKEREQEEVSEIEIQISSDWWNTTYSVNHQIDGDKQSTLNNRENIFCKRDYSKLNTPGWDVIKGDYKVKESNYNTRDYLYYRNLKIKIVKYAIYPVVALTVLVIIAILKMITKI